MRRQKQDLSSLIGAMNRKNRIERKAREIRLRKKIEAAFDEIERLLILFRETDPGLKRVILFGSLGENRVKNENFDIDLAVEGQEFARCVAIALDSSFKVDLVDPEDLPSAVRSHILQNGKVVYDAEQE
jgi:predicted nucleotidyltransferase